MLHPGGDGVPSDGSVVYGRAPEPRDPEVVRRLLGGAHGGGGAAVAAAQADARLAAGGGGAAWPPRPRPCGHGDDSAPARAAREGRPAGLCRPASESIGSLLRGEHSPDDPAAPPPADLGRASRPGYRNVVRAGDDPTRSFGVPSVRTDQPAARDGRPRSLADRVNRGGEPGAGRLVAPGRGAEAGLTDDATGALRSEEWIVDAARAALGAEAGGADDALLRRAFARAARPAPAGCAGAAEGEPACSLAAFLRAKRAVETEEAW